MPATGPETLPWERIRWVLRDMDGTLLDLRFDEHFWQELVPRRWAQRRGLDLPTARRLLGPRFRRVEGTLAWYCLDYWAQELGLDLAALKREVAHLIAFHPEAPAFLEALGRSGRRRWLVTNAHPASLALKLERTRLGERVDAVLSAHELGLPKEEPAFWERLRRRLPFEPQATLLLDDNPAVLASASRYGIAHLRLVLGPGRAPPASLPPGVAWVRGFAPLMPPQGGDRA